MSSSNPLIVTEPDLPAVKSGTVAKTRTLVFLVVWAVSVAYMAVELKRGWVPHDEGTLGQAAERVLYGQMPHRDFDDYTGGLTYLHALAFRVLGVSSFSMRIVLFICFVAWVPILFFLASRFSSAITAGAVTLLAVAWSVPNYPGPMPSWYNLFFATAGTAALIRYIEKGSGRWVFLAGICGGMSALAKITAAYFVAGALLFFVFREQSNANEQSRGSSVRGRLYGATIAVALATFLLLLFRMIHTVPGISGLIFFVLPAFVLVVIILAREFSGVAGRDRERFTAIIGMCLPFAAGVAIPLLVFLVPYAISGSVHDLMRGLLATPTRAIRFAAFPVNDPAAMLTIIPFALPIIVGYECRALGRAICGGVCALSSCVVLVYSAKSALAYSLGLLSLQTAIPGLVLAGMAGMWVSRRQHALNVVREQEIMLLACIVSLCSLVQFPFAAPVYFLYVAPLVILLAMALFASRPRPPRFVLGSLIAFYLLFAVISITQYRLGLRSDPSSRVQRLNIARGGGIRVEPMDARVYEEVITLVQSHSKGQFIYAAPDCPEVYFLSGLRSPSRHYFEFAESPSLGVQALETIENLNVKVVAINKSPRFSGPMSHELQSALEHRFPYYADQGKFQVRWRE